MTVAHDTTCHLVCQFSHMQIEEENYQIPMSLKDTIDSDFPEFIIECLKVHNDFRSRHGVPDLRLSKEVSTVGAGNRDEILFAAVPVRARVGRHLCEKGKDASPRQQPQRREHLQLHGQKVATVVDRGRPEGGQLVVRRDQQVQLRSGRGQEGDSALQPVGVEEHCGSGGRDGHEQERGGLRGRQLPAPRQHGRPVRRQRGQARGGLIQEKNFANCILSLECSLGDEDGD
jgi:hypothetical protein